MARGRMRIGITGGKGGTGKSTVATALACYLASKQEVLLVDADADCPNDHLLLGIERELVQTVGQRIPKIDLEKCTRCAKCGQVCRASALVATEGKDPFFIPAQCNGCGSCRIVCLDNAIYWDSKQVGFIYEGQGQGVALLAGELKVNEPVAERVIAELNREIKERAGKYDFILIDTAAGTHCDVVAALQEVDLVLAVTEPTPLGLHDLLLILDLIKQLDKPFEVILNRFEGDLGELDEVLAKYDKKVAACIPYDRKIIEAYAKGEPIKHESIEQIAQLIQELRV